MHNIALQGNDKLLEDEVEPTSNIPIGSSTTNAISTIAASNIPTRNVHHSAS